MTKDIRDLILEHQDTINGDELVDVKVLHTYYDLGRITAYCNGCQLVTVELRDGATKIIESLYDLIGEGSCWKVSKKQLECKFGYLRNVAKLKPKAKAKAKAWQSIEIDHD